MGVDCDTDRRNSFAQPAQRTSPVPELTLETAVTGQSVTPRGSEQPVIVTPPTAAAVPRRPAGRLVAIDDRRASGHPNIHHHAYPHQHQP